MNILYEDNHIIVAVKPPNLPVQADESGDSDMLSELKAYIKTKYNKPGEVYLGLVHRLDRPVGGVIVFARTSKAASRLSAQFKGRGTRKKYAAVVCGEAPASAELYDMLLRDECTGSVSVAGDETPDAKAAKLSYRKIAYAGGLSLLDIALHTGRHHQIRVQLASRNLPIWGDARYNASATPGQQIALWAYSLSFEHPTLHEVMTFTSLPYGGIWQNFTNQLAAMQLGLDIVYLDDNIVVVNKQANLAVTDADGEPDTLQLRLAGLIGPVFPVHRLDRNTTGLVMFARNTAAQDALSVAIRSRSISKFYRCLVKGVPQPSSGVLTAYGVKDDIKAYLYVYDAPRPGAKELVTGYRVIETRTDTSLLEVELITGRTHQIRAHMAYIGHPLLGDDKYGDREFNRAHKRQLIALCAIRLEMHFADGPLAYLNGKILEITPDNM
ncbi:MAG: pseudouridine synthase [Clostridia bacterium]